MLSGLLPLNAVAEMVNIGTLFAFLMPRPFRAPAAMVVGPLAIASCLYLMLSLPRTTQVRFLIWTALGLLVYRLYGYRHSALAPEGISNPRNALN